jgi:beta-glucanase (GH16 family)
MPAGDWIWPAIWMMPARDVYGGWPRSGEIDIAEARGNRLLFDGDVNVGVEQTGFTMHFGPAWNINGWPTTHFNHNQSPGFDADFHVYKIVWTDESIEYYVDDTLHHTVEAGDGFWARGNFTGDNIWEGQGAMAPFNQEFYIILNNAVGGVNYFNDRFRNEPTPKPWSNNSPQAARDFWDARSRWLPTWNMDTDDSHLQVYITSQHL